jgi:hypothetical protein
MFKVFERGFSITFENDVTVSVQWAEYNYCSRRMNNEEHRLIDAEMLEQGIKQYSSRTAEVMVEKDGKAWCIRGEDNPVEGWLSPELVAMILHVAAIKDITEGDFLTEMGKHSH